MNTCRCGLWATLIASMARCGSPSLHRASAATAMSWGVSWAIRRTASKSPGEAAGKPASMTSTLRRASCRATSSFSAAVRPAPGACSPSRRVVSKMRTLPAGTKGPAGRRAGRGSLRLPGFDGDRIQERHLRAKLGTDLLDLVVAILLAEPLELLATGVVLVDPALGERAGLDVGQDVLHGRLGALRDARPGDVIAELGRIRHREAHEVEAAAVHQIDD